MFKRNYIYHLKEIFRVKEVMFWNLLFPIILTTLMYVSFSNIATQDLIGQIDVASDSQMFNQVVEEMLKDEGGGFITLVKSNDPKADVENEVITGYISTSGENLTLLAKKESLQTSFLYNFLNVFNHKIKLLNVASEKGAFNSGDVNLTINKITSFENHVVSGFNSLGKTPMNTFYYAIMAMVCLGATTLGAGVVTAINNIPSNTFSKRLLISPVNKGKQIAPRMAATFTISVLQTTIVLLYLRYILKIDFGDKFLWLIPGVLVGTLFGVLIGVLIALVVNRDLNFVTGVTTSFYLLSSFFAGMMQKEIPVIIENSFPIFNRINPGTLIYKYFYTLYYFDDYENILNRLIALLIATGIVAVMVMIMARRRDNSNG